MLRIYCKIIVIIYLAWCTLFRMFLDNVRSKNPLRPRLRGAVAGRDQDLQSRGRFLQLCAEEG